MNYLLALQNLRRCLPDFVSVLMMRISDVGFYSSILLPMLIFWCFSKKGGALISLSFGSGYVFNQFLKNSFCVYRPWVKNAEIQPFPKAFKTATGYSFPSGHSQTAASCFGGLAVTYRKKKALAICMLVLVALVGFSRNFLGCHTPQDVFTGILVGFLNLILATAILNWAEKVHGRDKWLVLGGIVISVVLIIFAEFKPYPMDYNAEGGLIVDPEPMKKDCFGAAGYLLGAVVGWFLERRFVNFEIDGIWWKKVFRFILGAIPLGIMYGLLHPLLKHSLGIKWGEFLSFLIMGLYIMVVWPIVIKLIQKKTAHK